MSALEKPVRFRGKGEMNKQEIGELIRQMEDLPTLPSVVVKIIGALLDETSSAGDVAEIVEVDPSLTMKVLMVANSAFYGPPRGVSTVRQAIVSLGFKRLKSIILSLSVLDTVEAMAEESALDSEEFWAHSLTCAVCSEDLANKLGEEFSEEIFVAGLLHDIGKLILSRHAPAAFRESVEMARRENIGQAEAERAVMDMDHAQVGECIMDQWQFPIPLRRSIELHHHPSLEHIDDDVSCRMAAILCLADILSNERSVEFSRVREFARGEEIREKLGLSKTDVEEVADGLDDRVAQITKALGLDVDDISRATYSQILQRASAELGRMSLLLRESEERHRGIFESIQDVYLEVRIDDGSILEVSPSIQQLSGYSREEVLGKSIFSFYTRPETREELLQALERAGSIGEYEVSLTDKQGREVPCSFSAKIVTDDVGTPPKIIGTMRDITERKEAEERIRAQERLAAVGQLAAGIAHDFNNLLTGVIGYAELLQLRADMPEAAKKDLNRIKGQGRSAAQLIGQILDFSRKSIMERKPLDLAPFLKESVKFLERTIPESIRIVLYIDYGECFVNADPVQMQQVLTNLAVNARDAMSEGGDLRFRLSRLTLEAGERPPVPEMQPGKWAVLSVSDTGVGIPPDVLPRIYEPFFTTKNPAVGRGTGLGLAQVYGIVVQHEGFIAAESQEGKGTTFFVYLPELVTVDTQRDVYAEKEVSGGTEGLLLVEDESEVLMVGQGLLESLGYSVLTALDGMEALEVYRAHRDRIALVLMDMVMPGMGGKELCEALRQISPEVKGVAFSGYDMQESELRAFGFKGFVRKPFRREELAQVVREALDDRDRGFSSGQGDTQDEG